MEKRGAVRESELQVIGFHGRRMAIKWVRNLGYGAFGVSALFALLGWLSWRAVGADIACTGNGCGFAAVILAILFVIFAIAFCVAAAVFGLVGASFVVAARKAASIEPSESPDEGPPVVVDATFRTKK